MRSTARTSSGQQSVKGVVARTPDPECDPWSASLAAETTASSASAFTYDQGNNRTARAVTTTISGSPSTVTTRYTVNTLNQLTSYTDGTTTTTLSYAAAGARTARAGTTWRLRP